MIKLPDGLFVDALGYSKAERLGDGISAGNKAKLLAELEDAGLASADLADQLDYLNTPKEYDLGSAPLISVEQVDYAALQRWVQNIMFGIMLHHPDKEPIWQGRVASLLNSQVQTDPVLLSSPKLTGLVAKLAEDGITASLEALFSVPDPSWQSVVRATPASYVLAVAGEEMPRVIVQAGDLS